MKKHLFLIALICTLLVGCKPDPVLPTVKTLGVTEITETSALCMGDITDNGNATITAKGFCWSTEQNPTLENGFTTEADYRRDEPVPPFYATITDLLANTTYYVRAYATNSEGTAYGENINFVTAEATPEDPYNGHEYVDMGFTSGVKWATCNIGATTPEGYGEYFAWGEIATKELYESSNCSSYYKDLGDISGNPEYDVATAKWGKGWRMPRLQDMYELVTQCQWIWSNVNGIDGFNVVSNINGNHIFLPASGWMCTMIEDGVLDQGEWGYYWTTTPYSEEIEGKENTNTKACCVTFSSGGFMTEYGMRRNGFVVRPVID